jgi:two-component system OmpR family sensor kinase
MTRPRSLQRRLGVGLAIGVTGMWLVAMLAAGFIVRHELDEAFDSALQETSQRLLPLAVLDVMGREGSQQTRHVAPLKAHREFLTYLVRDLTGRVLIRSHQADLAAFPPVPATGFRSTATHRLYGEAAISGTIVIEIAEALAHRREAALEAVAGLLAPLPILIPLSVAGVWWFVRRSMAPVLVFNAEIEARGDGNLAPVSAEPLPAEIHPVAEAVNRLMERLRRSLDAERSFAANSAHELRTPIAATLAQTQRLIAEAPEGALRERARQIESALRGLAHLSEKLMQLARAEGGSILGETPQDLSPVLAHLVDEFRRRPKNADRLRLEAPACAGLWSHMEPDAFAVLMRNLIENALMHGGGGDVIVTTDGASRLRVVNGGVTIPGHILTTLKARFARGRTDARGAGLGLAIADAIATGAGARLELISPATGCTNGFEAVLHLPAVEVAGKRQ